MQNWEIRAAGRREGEESMTDCISDFTSSSRSVSTAPVGRRQSGVWPRGPWGRAFPVVGRRPTLTRRLPSPTNSRGGAAAGRMPRSRRSVSAKSGRARATRRPAHAPRRRARRRRRHVGQRTRRRHSSRPRSKPPPPPPPRAPPPRAPPPRVQSPEPNPFGAPNPLCLRTWSPLLA